MNKKFIILSFLTFKAFSMAKIVDYAMAGDIDQIELLLTKGQVNVQNEYGHSALSMAVYNNDPVMTYMLVKNGADLNLKYKDGNSALLIACLYNYIEIAQILIYSGADIEIKNKYGVNALELAEKLNHKTIAQMIKNYLKFKQI